MSEELKPCPYCNANRHIIRHWNVADDKNHTLAVECAACHARCSEVASVSYEVAKTKAVAAWNAIPRQDSLMSRLGARIVADKLACPKHDGVRILLHQAVQLSCAKDDEDTEEILNIALSIAVSALRVYEDVEARNK